MKYHGAPVILVLESLNDFYVGVTRCSLELASVCLNRPEDRYVQQLFVVERHVAAVHPKSMCCLLVVAFRC